jgi:hypothetical protein
VRGRGVFHTDPLSVAMIHSANIIGLRWELPDLALKYTSIYADIYFSLFLILFCRWHEQTQMPKERSENEKNSSFKFTNYYND